MNSNGLRRSPPSRSGARGCSPASTGANKYRAKSTVVDGIRFDSKAEARHYAELKLLERAGEINSIMVQHPHRLHAAGPDGIKRSIGVHYIDFSYWDVARKDRRYVEVKGVDHALGKWKRHHAEAEYGIKVEVVK